MPFKENIFEQILLGDLFKIALSRYLQLEKRLSTNPILYDEYRNIINEYIKLKHMRVATNKELASQQIYYVLHHAVFKETSTTTKVRPVFDASCKTTNGRSLNDLVYIGPTIQNDLFSILVHWRKRRVAMTADIEKMYRQIWMHKDDAKFQTILWRNSPKESIVAYVIHTVMFGNASASFQAIRALHQIAEEISASHPTTAKIIKNQFYVDDFLGSADSTKEAVIIQQQLVKALAQYGFPLRKCSHKSRNPKIMIQSNSTSTIVVKH